MIVPLVQPINTAHSPESLAEQLPPGSGIVVLRSALFDPERGRYSLVTAFPFLTLTTRGSTCQLRGDYGAREHFGNPWPLMDSLMGRFEMLDEPDFPFPLGGCFGCWGYDLAHFLEPRVQPRLSPDFDAPDSYLGFHDSLVAFDHVLGKTWLISTGLTESGERSADRAKAMIERWKRLLGNAAASCQSPTPHRFSQPPPLRSNMQREDYLRAVEQARRYIRQGDIYQVNLAHRLRADRPVPGWGLFKALAAASPGTFAAFMDGGSFQIASSSPELFLRLSGSHAVTRPIKGTRPRSSEANRDAQLAYELQTSPKENAELVMITDLLRNDLGRVCEYGSVRVPDLCRLERFAQVHHLVSTVEGRLRPEVTHLAALASTFPGGSITGAPKIRAMQIIEELETVRRGFYTGCLGYLGFNRESQLSILIRAAIVTASATWFQVGAGIVADSDPALEYEETLAKAGGFQEALDLLTHRHAASLPRPKPGSEASALHPR